MDAVLGALKAFDALFDRVPKWDIRESFILHNQPWQHALPWGSALAYLLVINFLPKLMKGHPGFRGPLKYFLFFWNLVLSLGSFLIAYGFGRHYLVSIANDGFFEIACMEGGAFFAGPTTYYWWIWLFTVSKYAELFDTVFLILKNPSRPVGFLQWYHHLTVLLYTWYATICLYSIGFMFLYLNAIVHFFMYMYFAVTELGIRPGKLVAMPITFLQIFQMAWGIFCNGVFGYMWLVQGRDCFGNYSEYMLGSAVVMYASYLYLFVQFFVSKYMAPARPRRSGEGKEKTK